MAQETTVNPAANAQAVNAPMNARATAPTNTPAAAQVQAPMNARAAAPANAPVAAQTKPQTEAPTNAKVTAPAVAVAVTPEEVLHEKQAVLARKTRLVTACIVFACILLALWLLFGLVFGVSTMQGNDMYPRMLHGDTFFYSRHAGNCAVGDIVLYRVNGYPHVGRIVALSGDSVDMGGEGELLINGAVYDEEIFYPTYKTNSVLTFPYTVQEGEVFILGDYRLEAGDSRMYGAVLRKNIKGKVFAVWRTGNV